MALFHSLDNYESEVSKPKKTSMTDAEKVYRQFEKEFLNTELDGEFCLFGEQLYLKPKCIDVDKIKVVRNGLNLGTTCPGLSLFQILSCSVLPDT